MATISACSIIFASGCKKVLDSVVNCFAESSLFGINEQVDPSNSKIYIFKATYSGSHKLGEVKWTFGDGSEATTVGTESVSHTFSSGTFTVKAEGNISNGSETCKPAPVKTITVN